MTNPHRRAAALALALALATACSDKIYISTPAAPSPVERIDTVEFRVSGDLPFVVVRVSNSLDGLTQQSTVLPFTSTVSLVNRDAVFLSLDARASGTGFLHAAIFVNGTIFREASSAQLNPVVIVEGTYRRR